ncbi:MAG: NYN domain-containing protein [Nitrospira sp.]|nr:NYN domain-containing protein [Nitrospira sp.]
MNVFVYVAKECLHLYNGMGGLQQKRSQLFPEAFHVVKKLDGFFRDEAGCIDNVGVKGREKVGTHLIIDGYNLMGVMKGIPDKLECAREDLLDTLASYRYQKPYTMTVVFDGWRHDRPVEQHERCGGIDVIYSKRGEKADQVIQRLVRQHGRDCAVVTSDREIIAVARTHGAFVLEAWEFAAKLRGFSLARTVPYKELDTGEDERRSRGPEKKGNPHKLPKAERRRRHQLKRF